MIEEYPASNNPLKDSVGDVISTLNIDLANKTTQLTAVSLCSIAGIIY
jgi:hypothetical protein